MGGSCSSTACKMSPMMCCNLDNNGSDLQECAEKEILAHTIPRLSALGDGSKQVDDGFPSFLVMPAATFPSQQSLPSQQISSQQSLVQQHELMQYLQQQSEQQRQMQLHHQRQAEERMRQQRLEQEQLQFRQLQESRLTLPQQMEAAPQTLMTRATSSPMLQQVPSGRLVPQASPQLLDSSMTISEGDGSGSTKACPSREMTYAKVPVVMFDEDFY
eukprot:TRINITY_DN18248_c0_g1_i1.p1 TRINITY_DN18248_c0_g1~~TRINITY_DN18248_c0_g1_i1.p1  ORF type:complete len:216 (-),score=47.80 TRINITY_DN18248_c0_g1_i1:773-1420(-)